MVKVLNEQEFTNQLMDIARKKLKPVMDNACDAGYGVSKERSPNATGVTRSHLRRKRGRQGKNPLYVTSFGFEGLDEGRKNAISIMEIGLTIPIYVPTNTRAMQDWLLAINNPVLFGKPQILVGRNDNSRYKGGDKNPIQFGRNASKKYIEQKLNVKFK